MSAPIARRQLIRACARVSPLQTANSRAAGTSAIAFPLRSRAFVQPYSPLLLQRSFTVSSYRLSNGSSSPSTTEQIQEKPKGRIAQLYEKSKALIGFYKDGLKLLWANQKEAKALKQKVEEQGYVLNRAEFQLIHRSQKDMLKLIPFGLIFLILPESIPLWVIFVPSIIPSTCLQEVQISKQRKKLDDARQIMSKNVLAASERIPGLSVQDFLKPRSFEKFAKHYNYDFELAQIHKKNLSAYCRFMGLRGWGTKSMLEQRLTTHMDYLLKDDKLIAQEGIESLSLSDLQQAVEERGMRSIDTDEEQLQRRLEYWIKMHLNEPPIAPGLLIFSRMFLLNANYK
ncbi:hypothetical protein O0I10_000082 [Lichtheimia ornata]|uniref:Letm1 RBD domain-containing protein n=1 Tax=Lichtheimia ornata TaxID=688661 RepID=A0AAD7Y4S8_9FUNG|nr:uncharacterized protein O0I10_000082 [Lichtheimia ornata]KAJ8663808.1 hypothetical protein O0I10_000082 [Lichtheimia ornata]